MLQLQIYTNIKKTVILNYFLVSHIFNEFLRVSLGLSRRAVVKSVKMKMNEHEKTYTVVLQVVLMV